DRTSETQAFRGRVQLQPRRELKKRGALAGCGNPGLWEGARLQPCRREQKLRGALAPEGCLSPDQPSTQIANPFVFRINPLSPLFSGSTFTKSFIFRINTLFFDKITTDAPLKPALALIGYKSIVINIIQITLLLSIFSEQVPDKPFIFNINISFFQSLKGNARG
ncbi:MAG: hypothetical protein WBD10_00885, partial [Acidobacteriaceae bacterium]